MFQFDLNDFKDEEELILLKEWKKNDQQKSAGDKYKWNQI